MRLLAHWCLVAVRYSTDTRCALLMLISLWDGATLPKMSNSQERTYFFPTPRKIPVSTFCFFHSWHYSHFSQAISLAQTQLLTSWFIHWHYLPKASGDEAVWGRGGNGMGQHNFAFDVCYSITEILYLQGFIARVLVAQLPWGVAPAFFLPQICSSIVALPQLRMIGVNSVVHWWFLQTSGWVKRFVISSFGKGSPQVPLPFLDLPNLATVLALGQAWDLPHLAWAHHVHYALLFIIFDLN